MTKYRFVAVIASRMHRELRAAQATDAESATRNG